MDLLGFFNQGWVGSSIGILGVLFAAYQILRRLDARPVYQYTGQKLISSAGGLLPNEVVVSFNNAAVPRLSLTHIIFWNKGRSTIRGSDIAEDHPLVFFFNGGEVLKAEIVKTTRQAINASVTKIPNHESAVGLKFSFLDPQDGVAIKVLHTSNDTAPVFTGTIMGIPKGVKSLGKYPSLVRQTNRHGNSAAKVLLYLKILPYAMIIVGIIYLVRLLYVEYIELIDANAKIELSNKISVAFISILYLALGVIVLLLTRKRHPSALDIGS